MPGLLGKKFPTPIGQTMWPFFAAGLIVAYGVSSMQTAMSNTDEYRNDPRNPAARNAKKDH